jgi:hypothetical protein
MYREWHLRKWMPPQQFSSLLWGSQLGELLGVNPHDRFLSWKRAGNTNPARLLPDRTGGEWAGGGVRCRWGCWLTFLNNRLELAMGRSTGGDEGRKNLANWDFP